MKINLPCESLRRNLTPSVRFTQQCLIDRIVELQKRKNEQSVAGEHSSCRLASDIVFSSCPLNGVVNTETARAQRVDRVALFIFAVARRRVSLVAGCLPVA